MNTWKSVNDDLPPEGERVLVSQKAGHRIQIAALSGGEWHSEHGEVDIDVVYWTPLPATPTIWDEVFKLNSGKLHWFISVLRLKRAADILWTQWENSNSLGDEDFSGSADREIDVVATFLNALAMENLLKTCRLIEGLTVLNSNGVLDWGKDGGSDGHHQNGLSSQLKGVLFSPSDQELLGRLTATVQWGGRYPVPKKVQQMVVKHSRPKNTPPDPSYLPPMAFTEEERKLFNGLFERTYEYAQRKILPKISSSKSPK